jgi:osmoprotectant transport system ATP-binding protein
VIRLDGVSKSFDGGRTHAVRDVDLTVGEGELLALIGASGSGKTTTLRTINRLIEPTAGTVSIDGRDTAGVDPVELRRGIGWAIQAVGLFPHRTVAENVAVVPRLLGWDTGRTAARVDELLELVGLAPAVYRDRFPAALSGGQAQRVGVARALAGRPRVVLLDEPFGALDPVTRELLCEDFGRLRRELAVTGVMVTHDVTEALLLGDRVAVMDAGRIVACGTPAELLRDPGHPAAASLIEVAGRQARRLGDLLSGGADA